MKAVSQKMCVQNILMKFTSGANGERKMVGITSTVMEDFMHLFMNTEPMAKRFKYEVGNIKQRLVAIKMIHIMRDRFIPSKQ